MKTRRILIAEDNRDGAETLAGLLRLHGHTVEVTYNGERALQVAPDFRPEVAILDIGLPGLDGYELARRLRGLDATRDSLLIAATAYGSADDIDRAMAAGFDAHFVKPVPLVRFLQAIDDGT